MPGYVVHMAEAYRILSALSRGHEISADWRERFITGNLLPDTRLRGDKYISHFWNPDDMEKLAKAPDISLFTEKYGTSPDNPVLFGYLSHLYLDACYVKKFWPTIIEFYGSDGQREEKSARISCVKILKTGTTVPIGSFFSERYYYGDYTKMNCYFIDKYQIVPPRWEQIHDFSMDETRLEDMAAVCSALGKLRNMCSMGDEKNIKVFDLDRLETFIAETGEDFLAAYCRR